jgi:hypothetical protein
VLGRVVPLLTAAVTFVAGLVLFNRVVTEPAGRIVVGVGLAVLAGLAIGGVGRRRPDPTEVTIQAAAFGWTVAMLVDLTVQATWPDRYGWPMVVLYLSAGPVGFGTALAFRALLRRRSP